MFPYFTLFNKTIYMYAFMAIVGGLIAGWFTCIQARKKNLNVDDVIVWMLMICIGIFCGGHIFYAITNYDKFYLLLHAGSIKQFVNGFTIVFGGSVFYGGLIGGFSVGMIHLAVRHSNITEHADIIAPAVPLFHGFARIGCFLGGCCYGIESPFGFTYTHSLVEAANNVNRFPVQLLESACNFALFAVLWMMLSKGKLKGMLFPMYILMYSVIRFSDEFLRGDAIRGFVGCLSTSQFVSIILFVISAGFIIFASIKKHNHVESEL